jgi:hypothetical protein
LLDLRYVEGDIFLRQSIGVHERQKGDRNASHALFPNMKYPSNYTISYIVSRIRPQFRVKKYEADPYIELYIAQAAHGNHRTHFRSLFAYT